MARLLLGILMVAWSFAGWRNLPRLPQPQASAAGMAIAGSLAFAYWLGKRRSRESAVAIATAHAEAAALAAVTATTTASSQVVLNISPDLGARRAGDALGLADAPWLAGASRNTFELTESETDYTDSVVSDLDQSEDLAVSPGVSGRPKPG